MEEVVEMVDVESAQFLLVADVAKKIDRSPEGVRRLERQGRIRSIRTAGGTRLFRREDVEAYLRQRPRVTR